MWFWWKYAPNSCWFCKCCAEALPSHSLLQLSRKKKEEEKAQFSCFPSSFPHFLGEEVFCLSSAILSYKVSFVSLKPTFLETTVGVATCLGEHWPFQITVHACRKREFGLYRVNVQLNFFFKTKEALSAKDVKHNSLLRFGKRNFKRQHLQGETMNRTTIPGLPILEYKVSHSMYFPRNYVDPGNRASSCHLLWDYH